MHENDAHRSVGWSAHELVFSGLSWPTLDKPFWLDVGKTLLSLSQTVSNGSWRAAGSSACITYAPCGTSQDLRMNIQSTLNTQKRSCRLSFY